MAVAKKSRKRSKRSSTEGVKEHDLFDISQIPKELPVLASQDLVAFPTVLLSFYVGREQSINAVRDAQENKDGYIFIVAEKNLRDGDEIDPKDLYKVGVVARVIRSLSIEEGTSKVLVQGIIRAKATYAKKSDRCIYCTIEALSQRGRSRLTKKERRSVEELIEQLAGVPTYGDIIDDLLMIIGDVEQKGAFADILCAHLDLPTLKAQKALEELNDTKRFEYVRDLLSDELHKYVISEEIRDKAELELSRDQREALLREQLRQIKEELGESDDQDLSELREQIDKAKLPKPVRMEAEKQFRRLEHMSLDSGDAALIRTYLDWIVSLPWKKSSRESLDLRKAKKILDEDHYGLEKVKDRILEHLSVRKLNKNSQGPILCLVGPPGVGKTSIGKSVARALNRGFYRISLGGMRDEAEIRGHRRTYVGALPGQIIQGIKAVGTNNPVFMLDEIDKIGSDFRGDPAAALLEVLDPHQNSSFMDNYLNVPFNLSKVLFFATANTTDTIPSALLDRLEIISIPGYTTEEKIKIAERYLVPRQFEAAGLSKFKIDFPEDALRFLIERYTQEAGVRNLEREIGAIARRCARIYAETKSLPAEITENTIKEFLGNTRYDPESLEREETIGVVTGLAWTIYGGEPLVVEASIAKGKGKLILTGRLGEVMRESAQAAIFYARSFADELGLDPFFYEKFDIHVHCPSGATPKDGPSAGITIATAVVSALSKREVKRNIAMTGEITLRGNVLAVGGIKEKALAALRYGIDTIIIPKDNLKDLDDIPKEQREKLNFIPVIHIRQVLNHALVETGDKAKIIKSGKKSRLSVDKIL